MDQPLDPLGSTGPRVSTAPIVSPGPFAGSEGPPELTSEQVRQLADLLSDGLGGLDPVTQRTSRAGMFALLSLARRGDDAGRSEGAPQRDAGRRPGGEPAAGGGDRIGG